MRSNVDCALGNVQSSVVPRSIPRPGRPGCICTGELPRPGNQGDPWCIYMYQGSLGLYTKVITLSPLYSQVPGGLYICPQAALKPCGKKLALEYLHLLRCVSAALGNCVLKLITISMQFFKLVSGSHKFSWGPNPFQLTRYCSLRPWRWWLRISLTSHSLLPLTYVGLGTVWQPSIASSSCFCNSDT